MDMILRTGFIIILLTSLAVAATASDAALTKQESPASPATREAAPASTVETPWQQKSVQGYLQLADGNLVRALASFEEALQMNPHGAAAKTGKGIVLVRQGKFSEGEELLVESLKLNPDPTRAHYELGKIYQQRGDYEQAITEFKLAIDHYRENHP